MAKREGNKIIGKVKTVTIEKEPTQKETGLATFDFRDEYSIFDYGRMPDDIPFKGESLCRMTVQNFKELANKGIKSHFVKSISPKEFQVNTVRILYPQKGEIETNTTNFLIPLEIIFRNSLPEGSSMLKRLRSGAITPQDIGLDRMPEPFEKLDKPIVDYTTKLEKDDRHLTIPEAKELAKITDEEFAKIEETALAVNSFLNEKAEKIGLSHADGKIELAFDPNREIILVDTFGTLDEDRFLFGKTHLSKQILRDYYAKTGWGEEIMKKESGKEYTLTAPEKMPEELLTITSNMYKSVCEAWCNESIWGAPKLSEVVSNLNSFMEKMGENK